MQKENSAFKFGRRLLFFLNGGGGVEGHSSLDPPKQELPAEEAWYEIK